MNKKMTVSIGIPAYQSEANITKLLMSLGTQKETFIKIEKISVYSDGSKDDTVKKCLTVKKKFPEKIQIFDAKINKGYSYGLQYVIDKNESDFIVLLNDDIRIESNDLIEQLIKPMLKDRSVDLVGGNIIPLPPRNFIGKSVYASYLAFLPMRVNYRSGNNGLTFDGKIMGLRKRFADTLKLTDASTGNVDCFIYIQNLIQKRSYSFAQEAKVFYRLAESIVDYRNQETRARLTYQILKQEFGNIVEEQWRLPKKIYYMSMLRVFLQYPIESLFFKLFMNSFFKMPKEKKFMKWDLAKSTKDL